MKSCCLDYYSIKAVDTCQLISEGQLAEKREIFITQTLKMMMTFHDSFYQKNPYFFRVQKLTVRKITIFAKPKDSLCLKISRGKVFPTQLFMIGISFFILSDDDDCESFWDVISSSTIRFSIVHQKSLSYSPLACYNSPPLSLRYQI